VALDCGGLREVTARLVGFDTPETKRAGCAAEAALGRQATERLRALVASGPARLTRKGIDKYRRPLMRLQIKGEDVGDVLIREGLAVAYTGGKRIDWCARLQE
jgi:endonuclease YncB( thermonuclease family)